MALTKLRDKEFIADNPIEVDEACEKLRVLFKDNLTWVSHPYHIAQRFLVKNAAEKKLMMPQTYIPDENDTNYSYHPLTPDNSYSGMFFFMVGPEKPDFTANQNNLLTYPVSIIFSANLELIDKEKLKRGLFTQELIKSVRRLLTENAAIFDFQYNIKLITRDLRECYREFILEEVESYNKAPLQCFRFDLELKIMESC